MATIQTPLFGATFPLASVRRQSSSVRGDSGGQNLAMAAVCFLPLVRFKRRKHVYGCVVATIPIPPVSLLDFRFLRPQDGSKMTIVRIGVSRELEQRRR